MQAEWSLAELPECERGGGGGEGGYLAENMMPPEPDLLCPFAERVFQSPLHPPLGLAFKQRERREW